MGCHHQGISEAHGPVQDAAERGFAKPLASPPRG